MDRMACVELPAFPLQLLLKRHPGWADRPVAVVDRDQPQGVVLWVNEAARAAGVRAGMRYAAGLSLARTLQAGEVPPADVEQGLTDALGQLRRFSPGVEPCRDEPGVFWLDASGLSHLYASLRQWADEIAAALRTCGLQATAVVGFTRFGTYAIAKTVAAGRPVAVVRDAARERVLAGQTPLERLGIDPALRDSLVRLGVRTVRAFLELPPAGLRRRFGPEAQRLHRLAADDLQVPLQPLRAAEPLSAQHYFDAAESDARRLLFCVKRLLDRLLTAVAGRHEQLAELTLHLRLDRGAPHIEQVRPAAPTSDSGQLLNLVRLRLESLALGAGVTELRVSGRGVRTAAAQQGLFVERPRRDLAAANRALARLRAEFGDGAVLRARLTEGHLPEAQFAWEPLAALARSAPRAVACRPLVRRIHARPLPLPPRSRHAPDGWLVRGGVSGHVRDLAGPYLVSGGWWRSAVHREYYFARMRDDDVLWIYYDRPHRRWRWQGQVQ